VRRVIDAGDIARFCESNIVDGVDAVTRALEDHAVRWFETRDGVVHFGRTQAGFDHDAKTATDRQRPRCELFRLGYARIPLLDQAEIGRVAKRVCATPGHFYNFM